MGWEGERKGEEEREGKMEGERNGKREREEEEGGRRERSVGQPTLGGSTNLHLS